MRDNTWIRPRANPLDPPRITALPDGAFLAVNPTGNPAIGVVGETEAEARAAFIAAMYRREALREAWMADRKAETDE